LAKRPRSRRSREHSSSVVQPRLISVRVVLQEWVRRDRAGLSKPPTRAVDFVWSVRRVLLASPPIHGTGNDLRVAT
jgi:hypothetical protein